MADRAMSFSDVPRSGSLDGLVDIVFCGDDGVFEGES